jgi:hypothetical protein
MTLAILMAPMPDLSISTWDSAIQEKLKSFCLTHRDASSLGFRKGHPEGSATNQPMIEKHENEDSGTSSSAQASLNYVPEKHEPPTTFWGKIGHWMGSLPEWGVGGKKLAGKQLNFYIAFIASNGFLMFGYDQGVLSSLITLQSWQRVFPLMTPRELPNDLCWIDGDRNNPDPTQCTGDANLQAFAIAIYQIGCFLGAVVILFYGEKWGRKPSTFWGSLIMIIGEFIVFIGRRMATNILSGTIIQAAANGYAMICIGRVVGGIGNGMV